MLQKWCKLERCKSTFALRRQCTGMVQKHFCTLGEKVQKRFCSWASKAFKPFSPSNSHAIVVYHPQPLPSPPNNHPLTACDCCSWEGVECDGNDRVTRSWLPRTGLRGFISPSFSNLTKLTQLNPSHNCLSGPLPDGFFSSFTTLQIVDLSFNCLFGPLTISDTLPIVLQILDLSSNCFNGSIQSSFLWPAMNLRSFNVSNNFTGRIPSSICSSDSLSLVTLNFSYNGFHGPIRQGFGVCEKLEVLRAGFNFLSGSLPDDIYSAGALQEIFLPGNKLNGAIGESVINLANLRILALFGNEFISSIPSGIGKLSNLEQLLLHINNLNETLPQSLMNCTSLKALNLQVNKFVGELSALDFSKLQQLIIVDLGNNYFTGSLPTSLFFCKALNAI
ncbi:hypothetical protein LguiB_021285 [Lonicera macranthoides]